MKNILALIAQIDPATVIITGDKVGKNETVVGVLTDDLKRFWNFLETETEKRRPEHKKTLGEISRLKSEYIAIHLDLGEEHDHSGCSAKQQAIEALDEQLSKTSSEIQKVNEIFWNLLRLEFDIVDAPEIAIRENNQVVIIKQEELTGESMFGIDGLGSLEELLEMLESGRVPAEIRMISSLGKCRRGIFSKFFGS